MILVGADHITEFAAVHHDATEALKSWKALVEQQMYEHFVALKQTFASADYVKPFTVFDIRGNHYRLVARVSYVSGTVSIQGIYTHTEYDSGKWRGP